jgi:hypothetical protein
LKFGLWNGGALCRMCQNLVSSCTFSVIYATMNTEHHVFQVVDIYMLHCMWAVSEHAHLPRRAVKASLGLWNQLWFSSLGMVTMLLDQVLTIRPTSFLSSIRRHLRCNPLIPHHIQFSVSARPGLCYTSSHWLLFFQFFLCCVVGQHLKRDLA